MGFGMKKKDLDRLLSKSVVKNVNEDFDLKNLKLANGNKKSKSNSTPARKQLDSAIELLKKIDKNDEFFFNEDCSKCVLKFNNVRLLSNNVSLNLGSRQMQEYKILWKERVQLLINESILEKWKPSSDNKILVEFCHDVNWDFMDYDGRIASIKAPLDGLEHSGLLIDDSWRHVSMILGKQRKSKTPSLTIMLSIEKDEDRYYTSDFLEYLKDN